MIEVKSRPWGQHGAREDTGRSMRMGTGLCHCSAWGGGVGRGPCGLSHLALVLLEEATAALLLLGSSPLAGTLGVVGQVAGSPQRFDSCVSPQFWPSLLRGLELFLGTAVTRQLLTACCPGCPGCPAFGPAAPPLAVPPTLHLCPAGDPISCHLMVPKSRAGFGLGCLDGLGAQAQPSVSSLASGPA